LVTGARKQILNEIKKCDVVCSNCHRERTHHRSKNLSVSPLATNQLKE
jgi:predicted HNH restriction endonuclease